MLPSGDVGQALGSGEETDGLHGPDLCGGPRSAEREDLLLRLVLGPVDRRDQRQRRGAVPQQEAVRAVEQAVQEAAVPGPDDDEPVLRWAAAEARRWRAPLTVLRPRTRRSGGADPVDPAVHAPEVEVTVRDVPGVDPRELLRAASPAPLLVLGAGHGSFLHRLLDGPHRYLLRHCTSPLALVPPVHRPEDEPREEIVAVG